MVHVNEVWCRPCPTNLHSPTQCQSQPPVWTAFGSPFVNLITSDQMSTHGSRDTAPLCRESAGLCAQHLVSSRALNILYHRATLNHLNRRIMRIKPPLLARTSPSLFLSGIVILAGQDHPSWMMKWEGLVPQTLYLGRHTTQSQENPHGHQKPKTDPKN